MKDDIIRKITKKEYVVGVIGLGYVGLPLILSFVRHGFRALGFDIDRQKVQILNAGNSYIKHIHVEQIKEAIVTGRFIATDNFSHLSSCDAVLITVPTPLNKNREPDLQYIVKTSELISKQVRKGQLIVLESTTYPGTTEEVVIPIVENSGLKVNEDFYVAFSPEREDPNNSEYTTETIPKVVGASSNDALEVAVTLYSQVVSRVVPVSSLKIAEATKLLENIFRAVNIALVNELKMTFMKMGIDIWEVIEAAKTKPFGFMAFYPGPGLGGHCIPIDPFYLTWKAREFGIVTKFIELAGEINSTMPEYVVQRIIYVLNYYSKPIRGAKILILGLAYKPNVDDDRESPSYRIMEQLENLGANVFYNDPYIPVIKPSREYSKYAGRSSSPISKEYDAIVILTNHDAYSPQKLIELGLPIIDTRNLIPFKHPLVYKA